MRMWRAPNCANAPYLPIIMQKRETVNAKIYKPVILKKLIPDVPYTRAGRSKLTTPAFCTPFSIK
jgi:hypothetical protein